jgi:hypothetical protein
MYRSTVSRLRSSRNIGLTEALNHEVGFAFRSSVVESRISSMAGPHASRRGLMRHYDSVMTIARTRAVHRQHIVGRVAGGGTREAKARKQHTMPASVDEDTPDGAEEPSEHYEEPSDDGAKLRQVLMRSGEARRVGGDLWRHSYSSVRLDPWTQRRCRSAARFHRPSPPVVPASHDDRHAAVHEHRVSQVRRSGRLCNDRRV